MHIQIRGHILHLLPEKAMWWPQNKALFVSDLHLGKIEHFRREGIPLPADAGSHTLDVFQLLVERYHPQRVYILGDLFHSHHNPSVEKTRTVLQLFPQTEFILIEGNHDILASKTYDVLGIRVCSHLEEGPWWMTHEPMDLEDNTRVNICGHIHPGVRIKGRGRQSLSLPCFYMTEKQLILPAFGYFTGKAIKKQNPSASIYAIADKEVIHIPYKKTST